MHKLNLLNVVTMLTAVLVLSSCSSIPQSIDILSKPAEKVALDLPDVDRFTQRPIEWVVVTPENAEVIFEKMATENKKIVVFAVDEKGYEALTLNVTDLLKLVRQQKAVIAAYEQYYEDEK